MAWRMFAGNVVGMMLSVAVGCSASDISNPNPANADGTLCLGKADCPSTPLDASNGVDNSSNGMTDSDNGGNTVDVAKANPCVGYEALKGQEWECHGGKVINCVPECIAEDGTIFCHGFVSLISETEFDPSIENPTQIKMISGGFPTICYNKKAAN